MSEITTQKPLRVLMFGWEYPPHNSGGLGIACAGLTAALARSGTETIFVLPKRLSHSSSSPEKGIALRFADDLGELVTVHEIPSGVYSPYQTSSWLMSADEKERLSRLYVNNLIGEVEAYAERAREIAKSEHFDVIHAHDWLSFAAGLAAREVSGKPLVVHIHATEYDRSGGNRGNEYVYNLERKAFHAADQVVAISYFIRDLLIKYYEVDPAKITVVHNGTEPLSESEAALQNEPSPLDVLLQAGRKMVLFLGRITIQKGPDYFLEAALLVLEYWRVHHPKESLPLFVMAGSGDMEELMIRRVAELGIAEHFLFPGFVRGAERERLFKAASLFVMPSVSEPFGLVALEAAQRGTPTLISHQSGVSEVLHNTLRVNFWDSEEIANKIVCCLENEALASVLCQESESEVKGLTWDKAAERCVALYRTLIKPLTS